MEDKDPKTPEEEEVEGHALQDFTEAQDFTKREDDVEAHALRDFTEADEFTKRDDDAEDFV